MSEFIVTGGAGFIGSHLVHALVDAGHHVRVVDDFSTGLRENLDGLDGAIDVFEGSVLEPELLAEAFAGAEYCLHEAALPSVPRSIEDPVSSNRVNVEGSIQVFLAARNAGLKRVVYASSSSVYGSNSSSAPCHEDFSRAPMSPYGASKAAVEFYARTFSEIYEVDLVGLRYFNVFGPRQNPDSPYAAVVPIFITRMLAGESPPVFGDGEQSRDFTYVDNVVKANLEACGLDGRLSGIYNIACGETTSLLELVGHLNAFLGRNLAPAFLPGRKGDIHVSCADITRAHTVLGYSPEVDVEEGLRRTVAWFKQKEA